MLSGEDGARRIRFGRLLPILVENEEGHAPGQMESSTPLANPIGGTSSHTGASMESELKTVSRLGAELVALRNNCRCRLKRFMRLTYPRK